MLPLDALRGPLGRIDVVKMDVEGMEHRVAQGGRALFEAERPVVYLEYSPGLLRDVSGVPAAALLRFFLERGYAVEILHRTAPPESLAGLDAETAIARTDAACERHVREEAGTHLDLCLRPIGAPAPALNGA